MYRIFMLVLLLLTTPAFSTPCYGGDLNQQEYMIDKIEKLLNEKPDHWYISSDTFLYCENKDKLKKAINDLYPENSAYTNIVIGFRLMRGDDNSYVSFEKPDIGLLSDREKLFRRIDKIIKTQLYKKLKKEVGWYVENLEEKQTPKVEEKIVIKEENKERKNRL